MASRRGLVDPSLYRMCFPLRLTRWVHTRLLRRRFVVYDACAQYLTAPWVPHLIRKATPHAKLIVCIRDPVLQNLSWWRYDTRSLYADNLISQSRWRASPPHRPREDGLVHPADTSRSNLASTLGLDSGTFLAANPQPNSVLV